jgi:glycosyltransferase involved in cell wall biosynthesis
MKHLILCREYPPAPYPAGGIGTYARHIARLLAEAGETVHVVTERWDGAPDAMTVSCDGRLTVHRLALDMPEADAVAGDTDLPSQLLWSTCPSQVFSWQAALYSEALIERESIDVIEAQEWEAPLYYLQVRRALGLGPERQPPCIVHLHSPSAMIFEHNEWDRTLTDFLPLSRFEEYTIRAADCLLCPSHYLARGVAELFGLELDRIEIIRYPMGGTERIERPAEAWASNSICYVGRLELRKGVMEWVDAAVAVAGRHPTVTFDFFGSDTPIDGGVGRSVQGVLRSRIPRALRGRFRFHGSQSREQLFRALARTAIAVVPSRWENLPFTCIEAMATGLPVLVSPNGGMAELISDGQSGWVATNCSAAGLADALERALKTSPEDRARMGASAAERVRRACANDVVVRQHMELRARIARGGAQRSKWVAGKSRAVEMRDEGRAALGAIVTCLDNPGALAACIGDLRRLAEVTAIAIVADARFRDRLGTEVAGIPLHFVSAPSLTGARQLGLEALVGIAPQLGSVVFLDQDLRLQPRFATVCECVFAGQTAVGIVVPWIEFEGKKPWLDTGPCPVSLDGDEGPVPNGCAVRMEVLLREGGCGQEDAVWESLSGRGWMAVTYPEILVTAPNPARPAKRRYSGMALIQNRSAEFALQWFLATPLREKVRWAARLAAQPKRVIRWIGWQARATLRRALAPHRYKTATFRQSD